MSQNNIIVENLKIEKNKISILKDLSLTISKDKIVAIIGGDDFFNKTIIELLLGYISSDLKIAGNIFIDIDNDKKRIFDLSNEKLHNLRKKNIGVYYKESDIIFVNIEKIGKQMIELLLLKTDKKIKDIKKEIKEYMIFFDIPLKVFDKYPNNIKDSRKKILSFILLIIMKPMFLFLNEPFNVDIIVRKKMIYLLQKYKKEISILFVSSDISILKIGDFIDYSIIVDFDKVILKDTPHNIFNSNNPTIKNMIKEAFFIFD